ncbi:hypothetical protein [Bacillus sp. JJ1764]|uniref:hypothetical protein n=1 Tax=Bacillus sp. JJ1764 TaxID=3122964 RepID=UPI0030007D42
MKHTNKFVFLMAVLPWLSIPLIGKQSLKRFLPASLAMVIFVIVEGVYAEKKKWWWFTYNIKPNFLGEFPMIFGPFIVGSLWILKFTFGKFNWYMILNLLVDSFFTYFGIPILRKIGYGSLVRLTKPKLSLIFIIKSLLLYSFHLYYEKIFLKDNPTS